jgi:hypothetical protein
MNQPALAQQPQDNWYLEQTWRKTGGGLNATNGGLSSPYGVAIGPDGRIYVGDVGYGRIQVYLADGTYSFSITNGFGGGQNFSQPRGMITDSSGNLYVADLGRNCVFVFNADGSFLRKIGETNGSSPGQLNGVIDVAAARSGEIYVLEQENGRVSVFSTNGVFLRAWSENGSLDGQLFRPTSIAVSANDQVYVCQPKDDLTPSSAFLKMFDASGKFLSKVDLFFSSGYQPFIVVKFGPTSVRLDPSGLVHVLVTCQNQGEPVPQDYRPRWVVLYPDLTTCSDLRFSFDTFPEVSHVWPFHAVGPDGSMVLCNLYRAELWFYRYALREQGAPPGNATPLPGIGNQRQRPNSPLVDIDYQITDADDTNVFVGMLIFTNSASVPSLGSCIRYPTLVEGTSTNLGPGISANQVHRLTWNAGADWSINLGNYRVAILAKDQRTNFLDIHYLFLTNNYGMPSLKISRGPLNTDDFMQVWWWLLATGDQGIALSSNQVYGVSGVFTNKQLCTNGITTADGRSYIYAKMNVREATTPEVQWAKQGNMPSGSSPNQWTPARQVGGRPKAVNEWGFDTGSWDTNSCKWVVPLN